MSGLKNTSAVSVQNAAQSVNEDKIPVTLVFTPSEVGLVGVPVDKLPKSIKVSENKIEEKTFKHFGLTDYQQIKTRLQTEKSPFDAVVTSASDGGDLLAYLNPKTGKYVVYLNIEKKLYRALANKANEINTEIRADKKETSKNSSNPNENFAGRNGIDQTALQRAKFDKLLREAEIMPSSFGLPTKLTDLNHVIVTLPQGTSPNADSALSAYIEKRFGGGNLFGQDKLDILNSAKQNGVKVENLKVSPNNPRVVEFDLSIESLLKLQKSYLDVQSKVNTDVVVAEKIKHEMALNQFLLGAMQGAWDDAKGTYNTITSPLQTVRQIREAIGILSQLSTEDLKAITAELGNKALTATPGEAAYGAGYVVGTAAVEIILGKGAGVALSALSKTKAGAAFLARLGKLADKTGELANLGKVKIAEQFSDEAALFAANRLQRLAATQLYAGIPADALADLAIVSANKIKNGAVKFSEFSRQMVQEFGEKVRPKLIELYENAFEKVHGARKTLDLDELLGGHSIEKHIGKSDSWLRQRLLNEDIPFASTFRNEATANRTIGKFIIGNREVIEDWLKSGEHRLEKEFTMKEYVGNILGRGKGNAPLNKSIETNKVQIVLVRDNTPQGWHIKTSFPISPKSNFKW